MRQETRMPDAHHNVTADPFITPFQQVICSCTGALITSTCTTPLDVIKIRLQAQQKSGATRAASAASSAKTRRVWYRSRLMQTHCLCTECSVVEPTTARPRSRHLQASKFTGPMDALLRITRTEGVTVLWSGLTTTWVMAVPATVVYFTIYDQLKYRLGYKETDPSTIYIPVLAGCMARLFAATLISPLELVRTKMQSTVLSYSELRNAIALSVRNNGVLFLMRGLGPSLLRDVPFSAIYWFGYESVKSYNLRKSGSTETSVVQTFLAGAISGTLAAVLTLPFDVVKTHRQIELGEMMSTGGQRFKSSWSLVSELYRRNGLGALYTGLVPRVMKVTPACAIMISVYEYGKSFFKARNAKKLRGDHVS